MSRRYPKSQKEADKKYNAKFKVIPLRITLESYEKIKVIAELTNDSISGVVRKALENAVADSLEKHGADNIDTNTAHINPKQG